METDAHELVVTNGESGVRSLRQAGIPGEILAWADVLHDGPVPGNVSQDEFLRRRAEFLSGMGGGTEAEILARLTSRNATLSAWSRPVVVFLEHDLYDQLQLLEVLSLARHDVWLVPQDTFIAISSDDALRRAWEGRSPVTLEQRDEAAQVWHAFTATDPGGVGELAPVALPHLAAALHRWMEMFPDQSGLSRTERFVLDELSGSSRTAAQLFLASQNSEEAAFRGDWSFWQVLQGLEPYLIEGDQRDEPQLRTFRLTSLGGRVLAGKEDRVRCCGIDRWLGGTHLTRTNLWRRRDGRLVRDTTA